ncbi:MAG: flagellar hook-length control protein FliK [Mobilitalea sp.]
MDISNKLRTTQQGKAKSSNVENAKAKSAALHSANDDKSMPPLKEGQIVKGQIVDLRYQEVKIQIEPGNQIISAKLSGNIPLSIGQQASFIVSENSLNQILLTFRPENALSINDAMIMKALNAAMLPNTDRNRLLVSEMLKHQLPIDTTTLQNFIRLSQTGTESSPATLIFMHKNNIPLNFSNLNQINELLKGAAQLTNQINQTAKNITELFTVTNPSYSSTASAENAFIHDTLEASPSSALQASGSAGSVLRATLLNTNQSLINLLYPEDISKIEHSTATIQEQATFGNQSLLSNSSSVATTTNIIADVPGSTPLASGKSLPLLKELLGQADRSQIADLLSELPMESSTKQQLLEGTISTKEVLGFIQTALQKGDTHTLQFLQTPLYAKLLEEALLQRWTLTPEKVAMQEEVNNLYQQVEKDLGFIHHLLKNMEENSDVRSLQEPVQNLQNTVGLLRDFQNVFTYLPIPVQFKEQLSHADLYVMTKKKSTALSDEPLSVLIHLDMTHLGSMNIKLSMTRDMLQVSFHMENEASCNLLRANLPSLTEALEAKGYHVTASIHQETINPDVISNTLEDSLQPDAVKRYSFDIRT